MEPEEYIKKPCEGFTEFTSRGVSQALTDEHRVVYWNNKESKKPKVISFKEMEDRHLKSTNAGWRGNFKTSFSINNDTELDYTEGELRLQVSVKADGRVCKGGKDNYTSMRFSKKRKYERLLNLLQEHSLRHIDKKVNNEGYYEVIVYPKTPNKRFSEEYYQASKKQLEIIFDEVFHWDGSIVENKTGSKTKRYFSVNKSDADFIQYVSASQGYNTQISQDKRDEKYTDTHYTVNVMETGKGFRSIANKDKKIEFKKIPSEDGFKYCFTVPSGMLLVRREDKIFISGNSGKSHALLMEPLKHIKDPNYNAVFFRRTTAQLEGSLWPEAKKMYGNFKGIKFHEKKKTVVWPSGAKFKFDYMELDKHADYNHQGLQYSGIFWDEFTHYSMYQFQYLRTRMRSASKCSSYMKCSMNPDRDHFVFDWVEPFLLEEDILDEDGNYINEKRKGCPNKSLDGKIRFFVMVGDKVVSSWDKEGITKDYPHLEKMIGTYTFISGTIDDNPILDELEPAYRNRLENQTEIQKQRLRYGNWLARPEGSGYFERGWCEIVTQPPLEAVRLRSWDTASTLPSDLNPNPDWTAGVKMSKGKDGYYYIEHVKRFRDRPAGVNAEMLKTASLDGKDISVTVPQDPAAAGKAQALEHVKMFSENGFTCHTMPTGNDKVTRFSPFSALAEQGLVKVVEGSWNEEYFSELEAFIGDGKLKDDQVDATADAFIKLAQTRYIPSFTPKIVTNDNTRFKGF